MKNPPTYTIKEADKLGFRSITIAYSPKCKTDKKHLQNVLNDMAGVAHCLIETGFGIEVGRLKIELK